MSDAASDDYPDLPVRPGSPLGNRIRSERSAQGLTQRNIESMTNGVIKSGHLSQIEKGKIESPTPSILMELAEALHIPFDELMELAGHYTISRTEASEDRALTVLLQAARPLTEDQRAHVLNYIEFLRTQPFNK